MKNDLTDQTEQELKLTILNQEQRIATLETQVSQLIEVTDLLNQNTEALASAIREVVQAGIIMDREIKLWSSRN